jgi:hypothetical protein
LQQSSDTLAVVAERVGYGLGGGVLQGLQAHLWRHAEDGAAQRELGLIPIACFAKSSDPLL